jgi:TolB protein
VPTPAPKVLYPLVAFVSDRTGDDDIYLLNRATGQVVNLTHAPGEDRDPVFAPDGRSLAFRSNVEGRWAFYRIDLATGVRTALFDPSAEQGAYVGRLAWSPDGEDRYVYEFYNQGDLDLFAHNAGGARQQLTKHQAGDYDPAWRPDGAQVAFASWRDGQKDLYLAGPDGSGVAPLVHSADDEEEPAWHPGGGHLAFVRWQDHDADLYELNVDSGAETRLTSDPYPDRSPAYAPDGTLFWVRYVPGEPFEVHDPYRAGHWQLWMCPPGGTDQQVALALPGVDVYTPAAGDALWPERGTAPLVVPASEPAPLSDGTVELSVIDIEVAGNNPRMHPHLVESYQAWRDEVYVQTGYDFLGKVSDMFRPLGYSGREYGHLSWHRTGRAVDLLFEWRDPPDAPNQLMVVRDTLGAQTYWRLYLRCREQDGSMGEPLTVAPWTFWFSLDPAKEPQAYAAGGRPDHIPSGYYVDVTHLAKRHGWHRIASYQEADFDWKTDSVGREFWHYQRTDGLTWWEAMSQIYTQETLLESYGWTVCTEELEMDPEWLLAKGIPTPEASVSP